PWRAGPRRALLALGGEARAVPRARRGHLGRGVQGAGAQAHRGASGWLAAGLAVRAAGPARRRGPRDRPGPAPGGGGPPRAAVRRIYNIAGSFSGGGSAFLQGPPKVWAEQLAGLALDEGMSGFVLMADDAVTVERFAAEVAPAVRDLVESERALTRAGGSA